VALSARMVYAGYPRFDDHCRDATVDFLGPFPFAFARRRNANDGRRRKGTTETELQKMTDFFPGSTYVPLDPRGHVDVRRSIPLPEFPPWFALGLWLRRR
jgi:hypothetical protein